MLGKLNLGLLRGATAMTWIATGLLVVLVMANVVARYVLGIGILWAEEVSRLLFVWVVFLGAYIALCRRGHMALVLIVNLLPALPRRVVNALGWLLVLGFLVTLAVAGGHLVMGTMAFGRTTPILGISAAWGYLSVPVAATLMALQALEETIDAWRNPHFGDGTPASPLDAPL